MTKMKYVVDKRELKIIQVPYDYIECSICSRWCPPDDYIDIDENGEKLKHQTRTNCSICYNLPHDEFTEAVYNSFDNTILAAGWDDKERHDIQNEYIDLRNIAIKMNMAITKKQIIADMMELLDHVPDDALIFDWPEIRLDKDVDPKSGYYVMEAKC